MLAEKQEDIEANRGTVRWWLGHEGFGGKARKHHQHGKRRRPSEKEGDALLLDGFPHQGRNALVTIQCLGLSPPIFVPPLKGMKVGA
jgi:hypothetical protein